MGREENPSLSESHARLAERTLAPSNTYRSSPTDATNAERERRESTESTESTPIPTTQIRNTVLVCPPGNTNNAELPVASSSPHRTTKSPPGAPCSKQTRRPTRAHPTLPQNLDSLDWLDWLDWLDG